MLVLETSRLIVRRMTLDDAPFMLGLLNDPSWLRFIGDRGVRSLADARNYIEQGPLAMYARRGFGFYIVERKGQASPIGMCGLAKRDYLDDVDLGFAVLPEYCRNGYTYEAACAVRDYAHAQLGLERLVATTRPDNLASAALLEKLGMRLERNFTHPDGGRELLLYALDF